MSTTFVEAAFFSCAVSSIFDAPTHPYMPCVVWLLLVVVFPWSSCGEVWEEIQEHRTGLFDADVASQLEVHLHLLNLLKVAVRANKYPPACRRKPSLVAGNLTRVLPRGNTLDHSGLIVDLYFCFLSS